MAHFSEIDENNIVLRTIIVDDQHESYGSDWCHDLLGGTWIQTSYNHRIRKQYAFPGYAYIPDADVFVKPQPFSSWSLDANHDWQPPVPQPEEDGVWEWDETNQEWTR
jgi:hypothetical protein